MNEIVLRPGDALRIEKADGRVLTLVARPGGELWELRFRACRWSLRRLIRDWWARNVRGWHEQRNARYLAQYDERLLNDIGLGPGAGNTLATRIHVHRQQELRRIVMAQRGLL